MKYTKIKEYKVQLQGTRGRAIGLPKVWLDDNQVEPGDSIEFFREKIDNHDCLVLKVKKVTGEVKQPAAQIPASA